MSTQDDRANDRLYDDQVFKLIMERFDRVDYDNTDIKTSLTKHIEEDEKVYKVVEKHTTYWTLILYIIGALFVSVVGTVAASLVK